MSPLAKLIATPVLTLSLSLAAQAGTLQVVSVSPPAVSTAPVSTAIAVDFDRPLATSTVNAQTFRVFGRASGPTQGTFSFESSNQRVVFTPGGAFAAGEVVTINLSHDIQAADLSPLRSAGYAYQFKTKTAPAAMRFRTYDIMSNRINNAQTRIYGAQASDLDGDGFTDLATVNEVSADVRVFMSRADGTGRFGDFLTPEPIGVEASPNDGADFNHDGWMDLATSASSDDEVWVLLGDGTGAFPTKQSIAVGIEPHGIAAIDVDGDADLDLVNSNLGSNNLSLMINNGSGVFSSPTFLDGGGSGEYGLAAGDVNGDGILDLVASMLYDHDIAVRLGNGNGTFSAATSYSTGGATWVVVLDDLNGDNVLDAATANSFSHNTAILLGNGDGSFGAPALTTIGAHTVAVDLGDLDGDGDADRVVSSFGGGFWRVYKNDGLGNFAFVEEIDAPSNPSCAILYDADNDGDLDMALTDEIADVLILKKNVLDLRELFPR